MSGTQGKENTDILRIYVGSYAPSSESSIYYLEVELSKKTFRLLSTIDAGPCPSFICFNKKTNYLYAVNELTQETHQSHGFLHPLPSTQRRRSSAALWSSGGDAPCHLALSPAGDSLALCNYGSGSVVFYRLDSRGTPESILYRSTIEGSSTHPERQQSAHPHQVVYAPDGDYVYVPDLGSDAVHVFCVQNKEIRKTGTCIVRSGSGPRHMSIAPGGQFAYLACELSSSVMVLSLADAAHPRCVQECFAFDDEQAPYPRSFASHIEATQDYVYMANRGDDSVSIFKRMDDGKLTPAARLASEGKTPRHFALSASHNVLILANQDSNNLILFSLKSDGTTEPLAEYRDIPTPSCVIIEE